MERPLLVVIDDIDRLSAQEIPQLFQLVKANADFPKVIYLLLYEKIMVEKALDAISNTRGKDYLEKIVQVSFDVPAISQEKADHVLFSGLSETLGEQTIFRCWDKARWTELYNQQLRRYFPTLRAVYRFLGSFSFQLALFRAKDDASNESAGGLEVDPIDLIALECLRLFEPGGLHARLAGIKRILTRKRGNSLFNDEIEQSEVDQIIDGIMEPIPAERKAEVRALLGELFPPITAAYSYKGAIARHEDDWFRELRVCHDELFSRYFQLDLAENEMSQADTDRLLAALHERESAAAELQALDERGLLKMALERLNRYAKTGSVILTVAVETV